MTDGPQWTKMRCTRFRIVHALVDRLLAWAGSPKIVWGGVSRGAYMAKRPGVGFIALDLGIGLLALIAVSLLSLPGRTQSADLVLCDRIAADPSDPDKPADVKGTPEIAQSDVATAIKFCKVASASSRRAMYELGRAYAANRQMPEAVAAWRKAADKGSTSAMVELGVLLGTGLRRDQRSGRGTQTFRARCGSRQSSWRHQSCGSVRKWWCSIRPSQGEGAADEGGRSEFCRSAVPAWSNECRRCGRPEG